MASAPPPAGPATPEPQGSWTPSSPGFPQALPHPKAKLILILGVLGFVTCGLTSLVAFVIAGQAKKEIKQSNGRYQEDAALVIGRLLGIVALAVLIVFSLPFVLTLIL